MIDGIIFLYDIITVLESIRAMHWYNLKVIVNSSYSL